MATTSLESKMWIFICYRQERLQQTIISAAGKEVRDIFKQLVKNISKEKKVVDPMNIVLKCSPYFPG